MSRFASITVLVLVFAAVVSESAAATGSSSASEEVASLPAGARLRIVRRGPDARPMAGGWQDGRLVRVDSESLVLETSAGVATTIPRDSIERLDRSLGRHSRGRGALIGAGIAAVVGVASSLAYGASCEEEECTMGAAYGLLLYTPLAMGVGAAIGALVPPGDRWKPVQNERVSLRFDPDLRKAQVTVALSF